MSKFSLKRVLKKKNVVMVYGDIGWYPLLVPISIGIILSGGKLNRVM